MKISRRFIVMILTFCILSVVLELLGYLSAPFLSGPVICNNPPSAFILSYSPAAAAVITALLFREDIRAFGWGPGKGRYYLFALLFPLVWFPLQGGVSLALGIVIPAAPKESWENFATFMILFFPVLLIECLGEEIGWRGFLVPQVMKGTGSFILVGLVTAVIWTVWHFPTPNYAWLWKNGIPQGLAIGLISIIGMIGICLVYGWLRLASGSIWPCLLLHTVSDWTGGWPGQFLTAGPHGSSTGISFVSVLPVLYSLLLAAGVIWYVKRNPVTPRQVEVS